MTCISRQKVSLIGLYAISEETVSYTSTEWYRLVVAELHAYDFDSADEGVRLFSEEVCLDSVL